MNQDFTVVCVDAWDDTNGVPYGAKAVKTVVTYTNTGGSQVILNSIDETDLVGNFHHDFTLINPDTTKGICVACTPTNNAYHLASGGTFQTTNTIPADGQISQLHCAK